MSPSWVTAIPVTYNFEKNDEFKVEIYDIDDDANIQDLSAHDHLGELEFTLHEIVTCRDQKMNKPLKNKKKPTHKAEIIITAEEVPNNANSEIFIFETNCKLTESSGLYFFVVLKYKGDNNW